ncbi:MAG: hypothetical protein BYD32DRAFT_422735 [Podila humilis]|nr:MAG: hypothetical protein BYD32DRAFT_422735 [Podila humilis]
MMPFFIPPVNNNNHDSVRPCEATTSEGILDPTLMTPPMSPTDHSFASIESRFTSSFSLDVHSPQTDMTGSSGFGSLSSPNSSTSISTVDSISPRPISFHWEDYKESEDEDEQDEDYPHCDHSGYHSEHNDHPKRRQEETTSSSSSLEPKPYYQQFEGHHSVARRSRRSSSVSSPSSVPPYSSYFATGDIPEETTYDSFRHGIGLNVADMSEELAKARTKMNRASRAMKNMDNELEALQLSIDENKNTAATARTALEENFWRLECLAHNLEKDRQDLNKQLQSVGRDCGQAVETVTNWEVRIDWLGKRVDNTSEYVSELVLSEQECMSFVKMIIKQNKRYAMPAISRSTERNIKLLAPPKLKEITPTPAPSVPQPIRTPPLPAPYDTPTPRLVNIPISWLLDPILPQKPQEILSASAEPIHEDTRTSESPSGKRSTEPLAEVWRDFSRLTLAFESGQPRTPFTPFHRSGPRSKESTSGSLTGINAVVGPSFKTTSAIRRPQVENMTPMPRVLPVASSAPTSQLPGIKRRGKYLPVHSWLQFKFNRTMTTQGPLGKSVIKKDVGKPITFFQTTV